MSPSANVKLRKSYIALPVFVFALSIQIFAARSVTIPSRELSFEVYADERLTVILSGPIDFGPVPAGSFSRNGTPTSVWVLNTGQRTFILTDFQSTSLVGTVLFSPSRPDVLPGQKVEVGLTFKSSFQAPLGPFVASMRMVAANQFGLETINLVGLGSIIPPPQDIPEFRTALVIPTFMAAFLIITVISRRLGRITKLAFSVSAC